MTTGSLMQVKSIAECSLGLFCNTFDLHKVKIDLENHFLVFLRVAILHRFYCIEIGPYFFYPGSYSEDSLQRHSLLQQNSLQRQLYLH